MAIRCEVAIAFALVKLATRHKVSEACKLKYNLLLRRHTSCLAMTEFVFESIGESISLDQGIG